VIIDIDDTFVYHRTVGIANTLFVDAFYQSFSQKKPKKRFYRTSEMVVEILSFPFRPKKKIKTDRKRIHDLWKLAKTGIKLYLIHSFRSFVNLFGARVSNERLIRLWSKTVIELKVDKRDYELRKEDIKDYINQKMMHIYCDLRRNNPRMKVVAITEHFNVDGDLLSKILGADEIISNRFVFGKDGKITDSKISVKNADDKKRHATKVYYKYNPKSVALIIEDYDDLGLLKMRCLSHVIYKRRLWPYLPKKNKIITKGFGW